MMGKISIKGAFLLIGITTSFVSTAQTYRACAGADGPCSYVTVNNSSFSISRLGSMGGGIGIKVGRPNNLMSPCIEEKTAIARLYAKCNYDAATDQSREIARCSSLGNSTWGASVGHSVVFFNATYTIENATYDRCINQVSASFIQAQAYCAVVRADHEGMARTANGGRCSAHYQ